MFVLIASTHAQTNIKKIISINPEKTYQTIDGFGDCSMWQPLIDTYNNFHTSNPKKLDQIADMLFTNQNPDSSFNFRFNHQVELMACIDVNTNTYIPKSQKDNSNIYWYAQKLLERGGQVSFRQNSLPSFFYIDQNGKGRNNNVTEFMSIMASTIKNIKKDYGITFTSYTPMNESSSPWIPPGRPIGANCHLTDAETVTFILEARKAFDAAGLTDMKLAAFDALYLNNYARFNNMLNSSAIGLLDHLSYHEYQKNAEFQEYWYKAALKKGLKLRQTEWGDWNNLSVTLEHSQAKNYATYIFGALSNGKVSAWLAWELQFIFNITNKGWAPKEGAWMMAQYSRFADPGMQMVQVNDMGVSNGTLAFIQPGTGTRDLSYTTYNESVKTVDYVYDFNGFTNPVIKDIRITSGIYRFKKLNYTLNANNQLIISVPPEAMVSVRASFSDIASSTLIDKTNWSVVSYTSYETTGNNAVKNAIDGNTSTMWHTKYAGTDPFPHYFTIDLGASYSVNGFSYLPRQDASYNGVTADYELYLSQDGLTWGDAVSAGLFSKDHDEKRVNFYPVNARFVKFVSKSTVDGNKFSSCAEFNLYKVSNSPNAVEDVKNESVEIYPNPANGDFVRIDGVKSLSKVEIYTLAGEKVISTVLKDNILDIHGLPQGIYVLKVNDGNRAFKEKLVIN